MARRASLFSIAFLLCAIPSGLAGPACSRKHYKTASCVDKCNGKWGYPGTMMGMDPWGSVVKSSGSTNEDVWNAVIAHACGTEVTKSDSPGVAGAVGSSPSSLVSSESASETTSSSESISTTSEISTTSVSSTTTTSSTSTSTSSSTSSTKSTPTSTSTTPSPTSTTKTSTKETPTPTPTPTPTTTPAAFVAPSTSKKEEPKTTSVPASSSGGSSNSGGGSSSSGSTSASDIAAYLKGHNDVRRQHGAADLTWSDDLASKAQQWANGCVFEHSGGSLGAFGENLAAGSGDFSIAAGLKAWTDEVSEYDPSNPQPSHFTQVVWKASTQVGCAVQVCNTIFQGGGNANFYVCEYSVQGNFIGRFAENVQV